MKRRPVFLRRSAHFVPGPNERMLQKALASEADCLIIDLEDAVAPEVKDESRRILSAWLGEIDFGEKEVAVRINPLNSPWGLDDLAATMESPPHLYMIPKPERLTDVQLIESLISKYEVRYGHELGLVKLLLIAGETPLGVLNLSNLSATERIAAVTWGAEDLSTALSAKYNRNENGDYMRIFEYCREQTLLASIANGVQPIDTVYVELNDTEGLIRDCKHAADMGFTGKLTIHPNQISIVNEAFTPSLAEIQRAQRLVEAFVDMRKEGRNVFDFEGKMVDAPHFAQATAILARAKHAGVI